MARYVLMYQDISGPSIGRIGPNLARHRTSIAGVRRVRLDVLHHELAGRSAPATVSALKPPSGNLLPRPFQPGSQLRPVSSGLPDL